MSYDDIMRRIKEHRLNRCAKREKRGEFTYYTGTEGERKCHDCGCPTHNYRCDYCWSKIRCDSDSEMLHDGKYVEYFSSSILSSPKFSKIVAKIAVGR